MATPPKSSLPTAMSQSIQEIASPREASAIAVDSTAYIAVSEDERVSLNVSTIVYTSACLALLQSVQFGWSLSQLNLATFHDKHDCAARPVVTGTCVMFPGHTTTQWTWIVNAWVVGGMLGALGCGRVSDRYGRKTTMMLNCVVMAVAAVLQASASSVAMFAIGRALAGVASGASTATPNMYINEIAPPYLRDRLGGGIQLSVSLGVFLLALAFFVADTASGWRYIAGAPALIALLFAVTAPRLMVESPVWLLNQGRQSEAEREIAKLFGERGIPMALAWIHSSQSPRASLVSKSHVAEVILPSEHHGVTEPITINPWKALISPLCRQQTILAIAMVCALQFSGINAVFLYSSSIFKDAGVSDGRVGNLIVNIVYVLPSFVVSSLVHRFGKRHMLLGGKIVMLACAIGMTVSLVVNSGALSVVFTSVYVVGFSVSLGPLAFVVVAEVFPHALRASGTSLAMCANWMGMLVVGVGYPHVADALGDLGFLPFIVTLALLILFLIRNLPDTSGKTNDEIQQIFRRKLERTAE